METELRISVADAMAFLQVSRYYLHEYERFLQFDAGHRYALNDLERLKAMINKFGPQPKTLAILWNSKEAYGKN